MKHLFVIVGLSASGKTTMLREFCEEDYSFEYFGNDLICRQIWNMFNVEGFSVLDIGKWKKLSEIGNVGLASYWLHTVALAQLRGDVVFAEGSRYYFSDERSILEAAVNSIYPECQIHYIHLNPPAHVRNVYRQGRGLKPITSAELEHELSKYDTGFCAYEIVDKKDLGRVLKSCVGKVGSMVTKGKRFAFPDISFLVFRGRNLESIHVRYRSDLSLGARRLLERITNGLYRRWYRILSGVR